MKTLLRTVPVLLVAAFALTGATPPEVTRHFALSESSPEAGSTVSTPGELRLTFTQEPREGTVQIRLVEAEDVGVHVMDAAQDGSDPTVFSAMIHGSLPAGTYTVSWRGMGDDGHVVRDTFQFTVSAQ